MKTCPQCSSTEIDRDPQQGAAICMGCGLVLEDQLIVSEVQFQETASGGVSVVGQHLSAEGGLSLPISGILRPGFGRESQDATFQKGKRRIQQVASRLRLSTNCSDMAFGLFKLAVRRRFTRGRRTAQVIAACMYIACRDHNTPRILDVACALLPRAAAARGKSALLVLLGYLSSVLAMLANALVTRFESSYFRLQDMLLDFSDVLCINVYVLGKTYLQLAKLLCISVQGMDPCLLIHRFANRLEFGDKENEVAMTALRLVARMKRDWMDTGRRPSGLCGAALFVASRIHNFSRTIKDIICVVKVCESTVKKRLLEFEETPTSQLTVDEFHRIDLEEAADPPAFTMNRRKAKEMQQVAEPAEAEDDDDDELPAEGAAAAASAVDSAIDINEYSTEIASLSEKIDEAIETRASRKARKLEQEVLAMLGGTDEATQAEAFVEQMLEESIEQVGESHTTAVAATRAVASGNKLLAWTSPSGSRPCDQAAATRAAALRASAVGPRPSAVSLGIGVPDAEQVDGTRGPSSTSAAAAGKAGAQGNDELDLSGIDDGEIDQLLLSDDEIRKKTSLWMVLNADYLKEQEEKAKREAEELQSKPESARKKRKYRKRVALPASSTAGEAIEKIVLERKMSSKINYEVLKDLGLMTDTRTKAAAAAASVSSVPPADAVATVSPAVVPSESSAGSSSNLKRKAVASITPSTLRTKKQAKEELTEVQRSSQELSSSKSEVIVETAPLPIASASSAADYNAEDDEDLDEDDDVDDDEPVSAVRLFQQEADGFDEDDYGYDYD